jgi:hypothetical protein
MKKYMAIVSIIILFFCVSVHAGDDQKGGAGFWKGLIIKIGQFVPKKKLTVTTSVAGVRSASADDGDTLYWKDEKKQFVVTEEELDLFKAAVNEAMEGNRDGALKMFERFSVSYPESPLHIDAKKAIENLTAGSHQ